jgi:hypothetical protein
MNNMNFLIHTLHIPVMNVVQVILELPEPLLWLIDHGLLGFLQQINEELKISGNQEDTELFGVLCSRIRVDR